MPYKYYIEKENTFTTKFFIIGIAGRIKSEATKLVNTHLLTKLKCEKSRQKM